jgi:hypothetical protein
MMRNIVLCLSWNQGRHLGRETEFYCAPSGRVCPTLRPYIVYSRTSSGHISTHCHCHFISLLRNLILQDNGAPYLKLKILNPDFLNLRYSQNLLLMCVGQLSCNMLCNTKEIGTYSCERRIAPFSEKLNRT